MDNNHYHSGWKQQGYQQGQHTNDDIEAGEENQHDQPLGMPSQSYQPQMGFFQSPSQGWMAQGYNAQGYNDQGYNAQAYSAQGYNAQGYNDQGYNTQAYSAQGYNAQGYNDQGYNTQAYSAQGYNDQGYNAQGYNTQAYSAQGYNAQGYNAQGYNLNMNPWMAPAPQLQQHVQNTGTTYNQGMLPLQHHQVLGPQGQIQTLPPYTASLAAAPDPDSPDFSRPVSQATTNASARTRPTPSRANPQVVRRPAVPKKAQHPQQIRDPPEMSDAHVRLPQDTPIPPLAPITLGRGLESGRNRLALFGTDTVARTMERILVDRGRSGKMANENYPPVSSAVPPRITLDEVCRNYPNHVWGSFLRIFQAEGWTGRDIWEALPVDVRRIRHGKRPWNYIQQALGREIDAMHREETGRERIVQPRRRRSNPPRSPRPSARSVNPRAVSPSPSAQLNSPPVREASLRLEDLHQLGATAYLQSLDLLQNIVELTHPGMTDIEDIRIVAQRRWTAHVSNWAANIAASYRLASGERIDSSDAIRMLERIAVFMGSVDPQGLNETRAEFRARRRWEAWRQYTGVAQGWVRDWQRELGDLESNQRQAANEDNAVEDEDFEPEAVDDGSVDNQGVEDGNEVFEDDAMEDQLVEGPALAYQTVQNQGVQYQFVDNLAVDNQNEAVEEQPAENQGEDEHMDSSMGLWDNYDDLDWQDQVPMWDW